MIIEEKNDLFLKPMTLNDPLLSSFFMKCQMKSPNHRLTDSSAQKYGLSNFSGHYTVLKVDRPYFRAKLPLVPLFPTQ
jgi:hypothetical protein